MLLDKMTDWSWSEMAWFISITMVVHSAVVFSYGTALILIERNGWFEKAKVQVCKQYGLHAC